MKNNLKSIIASLMLSFSVLTFITTFNIAVLHPVFAAGEGVSGGLSDLKAEAGDAIVDPTDGATNKEAFSKLVANVIKWALYVVGAIAVIFVIIGGYYYLTAAGNDEQATKGRKTIVNALIGLVLVILAYVIVTVVANFLTSPN